MIIRKFEDIIAWQKARELVVMLYRLFKDTRDFSFRDQIQRAGVSVMNNVAEGFERQGGEVMKNFLYIAKGSNAEVRSKSYLAQDLGYITHAELLNLLERTDEIARLLSGFIKTL